eukprot:59375-Alexandrium_andersonii.AAC.1
MCIRDSGSRPTARAELAAQWHASMMRPAGTQAQGQAISQHGPWHFIRRQEAWPLAGWPAPDMLATFHRSGGVASTQHGSTSCVSAWTSGGMARIPHGSTSVLLRRNQG